MSQIYFGDVAKVWVSGDALDLYSGGLCLEYRQGQNDPELSVFVVPLITSMCIF